MDATLFLALSGAVYKFVEVLKPAVATAAARWGWTDDTRQAMVQLVAVILGVVLAFVAGGVNMIPASLPVPDVVGVVATGVVIGLGADVVNAVLGLFYGWQKTPAAK